MEDARFDRQIGFLREIDQLKQVFRQTWLLDGSRKENDAEHSWHLGVAAMLLAEYAEEPGLDLLTVMKMVLVHDLVEIDAGDTFAYDDEGGKTKAAREQAAADRIFGLLPDDQAAEFRALWDQFEARATPNARFAASLDRLMPLMHNYFTQGKAWREHGVRAEEVLKRNQHVAEGSKPLWEFARSLIQDAVARGYLAES
jgi:5'-deoxynucleotidase YfbR-like HD superfamily hydrolase